MRFLHYKITPYPAFQIVLLETSQYVKPTLKGWGVKFYFLEWRVALSHDIHVPPLISLVPY